MENIETNTELNNSESENTALGQDSNSVSESTALSGDNDVDSKDNNDIKEENNKESHNDLKNDQKEDKEDNEDHKKEDNTPEEYEKFKIPDGQEYLEDQAQEFSEIAKDLKLSQEQAQKLVDLQVRINQKYSDQLNETSEKWLTESKNTFGNKFNNVLSTASKGLDFAFGDDVGFVKEVLNNTRLGNNQAFIKGFYNIGKQVQESGFVAGSGNTAPSKTTAEILYPNSK
jgi:hypothetical protein